VLAEQHGDAGASRAAAVLGAKLALASEVPAWNMRS